MMEALVNNATLDLTIHSSNANLTAIRQLIIMQQHPRVKVAIVSVRHA